MVASSACSPIAELLKNHGYATGRFFWQKPPLGDLNKYLPTVHGFRRILRQSLSKREPEMYNYPAGFFRKFPPARRCDSREIWTMARSRVGAASANRRSPTLNSAPRREWRLLRRRIRRSGQGLHQATARHADKPFFCWLKTHPYAYVHAYQEGEPGAGRPLAITITTR